MAGLLLIPTVQPLAVERVAGRLPSALWLCYPSTAQRESIPPDA